MPTNRNTDLINRLLFYCMRGIYFFWKKKNIRQFDPRIWSNDELRKISSFFCGDVINVSAGYDKDKEGGEYKQYFLNSNSYSISNLKKTTTEKTEIELDLDRPIKGQIELDMKFDVVMTHTVLEHVYNFQTAIENLCLLSNDIVITIIPFIQSFHHQEEVYSDYWRFSPFAIKKLFEENKLETIRLVWNNDPLGNIYIFHVASKKPDKWRRKVKMGFPAGVEGPGYYRNMLVYNSNYCKNVIINKEL